ncbi:hypothetical protein Tsubulata_002955 [Turnera subulata]|uniref:PX domain-containing protein n=1 Tax=Turnera subulata TaxID=218843 RepID=A0A9Q0G0M9_9ROSI|nr:hypothetical protein Tsubulata_002955 [Turnera subulata]
MTGAGVETCDQVAGSAPHDPFDSKSCGADAVSPAASSSSSTVLSQYSTCGESEFERYCSANSAMGTPSLCSTSMGRFNDFNLESDFGSSLENFSLDGRIDRKFSNSGVDWIKGRNEGGSSSGIGDDGLVERRRRRESVEVGSDEENDDSGSGFGFDGREDFEAESDDGSMYGCGSGDESGKKLYVHRDVKSGGEAAKVENGNPLFINSSVAFGSDDWDDFELETGGSVAAPLALDGFEQQRGHDFESERDVFCSASVTATRMSSVGHTEIGKDAIKEPAGVRPGEIDELEDSFNSCSLLVPTGFEVAELEREEEVKDIPVASCEIHSVHELTKYDESNSLKALKDIVNPSATGNHVQGIDETTENWKGSVVDEHDPVEGKTSVDLGLNSIHCGTDGMESSVKSDKIIGIVDNKAFENQNMTVLDMEKDPPADTAIQKFASPADYSVNIKPNSTQTMSENNSAKTSPKASSVDYFEDHPAVIKAENFELIEMYAEIVDEMEEILLDSGESRGARLSQVNRMLPSQLSLPSRDGGSTASTSGTDDSYPLMTQQLKIDGVEVVGAKQKKGDVSLSERLVGVKEYTVYILRVWSGKEWWDVERRYRDFFTLYRRLKSLSADQGWALPPPWNSVEKESRKLFGNVSPNVVSERSILIQECLSSIIHSGKFSSLPSALIWFLSPQDSFLGSPPSKTQAPWSTVSGRGQDTETIPVLGKTISLVVEIRPYKSTKQMLEAQNNTCAGCHKHFNDGMTLMRDFVQTLGWGKPRLCEYTGQLFCSSCHTNDTAVLPARVLHQWDFTQYPVSQLAKSYLDSIYEQPMLCVSAVNPLLFSKVPALQHVMSVRKRIGTMLPYVHCPFRRTINKGLGCRRYLLESNDFFALRDLIDLSKGAFAALPVMVETVSSKILEHITEQCLVCCDVGIPCNARQACSDPSSLIFPFQVDILTEGEIKRCTSCGSVFHKLCFTKLTNCSCGAHIGGNENKGSSDKLNRSASSGILVRRSTSGLSASLLTGLFSKSNPENVDDHKGRDTVILMGSLPSTSLS